MTEYLDRYPTMHEYAEGKRIKPELTDLISREDALEQIAQAECGLHYADCEADNCSCSYIQRILDIPSAELPKGELISRADAICEVLVNDGIDNIVDRINALPSAEAVTIHEDGTLAVKVPNAHKVGRVLVMDTDSHIGGGLFYPEEAVQGEWRKISPARIYECSICNHNVLTDYIDTYNYCPSCGTRMKGGAE